MFKAEWGWFKNNKFYYVVMAALILIPTIYTVVFLSSLWNPYGETQDIPVAVVNLDQKKTYEGKELNLGADLAKNLTKSDAMDFSVISKSKAKEGIDDGKYYMVITIPKDFSKNATTLTTSKPTQMKLKYETSSGQSFVAGKMTEAAVKEVVTNVSTEVTKTYAKTLVGSIKQLGAGTKEASEANTKLASGTKDAQDGATAIQTNLQALADGSLTLENGTKQAQSKLSEYTAGVSQADAGSKTLSAGISDYTAGVASAATYSQQIKAGLDKMNSELNSSETQAQLAELNQEYAQLKPYLSDSGLQDLIKTYKTATNNSLDAALSANGIDGDKKAAIENDFANNQAKDESIVKIEAKLNSLIKDGKLSRAMQQIDSALGQVTELQTDVSRLSSGIDQVSDGLNTLNGKSAELQNGSQNITTGLDTLSGKNQEVLSGISQLSDGASTITSGSQTLASKSGELASGLGSAVSGNQTLADKLGDASKKTNSLKSNNTVFNQISKPVTSQGHEKDRIPNNGTGMTPYMYSVGLYVGMLSFNVMMDMVTPRRRPKSFLGWFGAKLSLLTFYGVVAASLVFALSTWLLGLRPVDPLATYGMLVLTAMTFGAIVTSMVLWFKKPGSFVAVVFLVLQLSGSAGTYPIQTSSAFFKWLNPYLPMTYAVRGFRETIMIGGSAWPDVKVLLGILVVFLIIMSGYYAVNMHTYKMMKDPVAIED
ncbi:YhgE/Pip domain-containing protein [Weissella muntiaci]|uniref:YhgE/Pip domain-containing protein n=1 Tax=Weissella muntiaci TaxID=2508881 RepID=A0A6C2C3L7_9LACO|nr:YhgE/Pip domain-containing protein [Weissella muntiaci]TYC48518.1 YhgE/Pip domain-containing protein [Weissella muntiaci]